MFFKAQEDSHSISVIKFYCGSTCLYFPPLAILILCTDLMFETGKLSFLPILGLIVLSECLKCVFINLYYRDSEKHFIKTSHKSVSVINAFKKWISERKIKDIAKSMLLLGIITLAYFAVAILFGAEFLSKNEETFMLSLMLMVLTALPACLHLGPNYALAAILGDEKYSVNPLSPVLQHVVRVTLLGAWFGAFVIPLDWDRPWQAWPVPCCVGGLMGYVASHATALVQVAMPRYFTCGISSKWS